MDECQPICRLFLLGRGMHCKKPVCRLPFSTCSMEVQKSHFANSLATNVGYQCSPHYFKKDWWGLFNNVAKGKKAPDVHFSLVFECVLTWSLSTVGTITEIQSGVLALLKLVVYFQVYMGWDAMLHHLHMLWSLHSQLQFNFCYMCNVCTMVRVLSKQLTMDHFLRRSKRQAAFELVHYILKVSSFIVKTFFSLISKSEEQERCYR